MVVRNIYLYWTFKFHEHLLTQENRFLGICRQQRVGGSMQGDPSGGKAEVVYGLL